MPLAHERVLAIRLHVGYDQTLPMHVKSNPWTGPEGSRMLRLPDFNTIDI
jgi:hypothetical protein